MNSEIENKKTSNIIVKHIFTNILYFMAHPSLLPFVFRAQPIILLIEHLYPFIWKAMSFRLYVVHQQ